MLASHVFWRLMLFNTHLLLLLQPSVLWLSTVIFNNDAKPTPKWFLLEFDVSRNRPRLGGLPHLEMFTWQNFTPAERVNRSSRPGYPPWRVPHQSCKRDQLKLRDYMDRRVTPPKRVTSPTWGPSPPCKQALRKIWAAICLDGPKPVMIVFFKVKFKRFVQGSQKFHIYPSSIKQKYDYSRYILP